MQCRAADVLSTCRLRIGANLLWVGRQPFVFVKCLGHASQIDPGSDDVDASAVQYSGVQILCGFVKSGQVTSGWDPVYVNWCASTCG